MSALGSTLWPVSCAFADTGADHDVLTSLPFRRWHGDLRIMRGIDMHELVEAGVLETHDEWLRFAADPYLFAIRASDARAVALYRLIDSRRSTALREVLAA